jgi:hypothetical protein
VLASGLRGQAQAAVIFAGADIGAPGPLNCCLFVYSSVNFVLRQIKFIKLIKITTVTNLNYF